MNTKELNELLDKTVKGWKIRLLGHAYALIEEGDLDYICDALRTAYDSLQADLEPKSPSILKEHTLKEVMPYIDYMAAKRAKEELLKYIAEALGADDEEAHGVCLEDWLQEHIPFLKFDVNVGGEIPWRCRLAWIGAMVISVETGTPVKGPSALVIPIDYED
jgi:hypothetical protein